MLTHAGWLQSRQWGGQRRFPPPELQFGSRREERGSAHHGVSNKPDTFKSLHKLNLSGRGTGILLGAASCQWD